ncbi:peptidylprolyl isomerase [Streptomyces sp. NPDC059533]|uniref:peptidylprolyl isomerase n=1 Tax=unclassified Streptomyces TaxID=2593676 RepID=UPI0036C846F4
MNLTSWKSFGDRRAVRKAAGVAAAIVACSGLAWTAVSLTTSTSTDSKRPEACLYTPTGKGNGDKSVGVPTYDTISARRPFMLTLSTSEGPITIQALTTQAPCTTNSFAYLAGKKYFDGSKCHRLTTKGIFVLECGDPAGVGTSDPGYSYPNENRKGATYPAGTVAVSKAQPGRNGGQFFISYADPLLRMPPEWTPFGKVIDGLEVVQKFAAKGTANGAPDGAPKEPVVIDSATVQYPKD